MSSYRRRLLAKYKVTLEEYQKLVEIQGSKCAICDAIPKGSIHNPSGLCVDHNHTSGNVRSLLCSTCNTMIGMAKDNPFILRSAADYLEKDLYLISQIPVSRDSRLFIANL